MSAGVTGLDDARGEASNHGISSSEKSRAYKGRSFGMNIRVSKESEVPLHQQVATQFVFLIGTGALQPGDALPSVRQLARRLGIHHNTVSQAYHDRVLSLLVEKRSGRRLVVRAPDEEPVGGGRDLEDLIARMVLEARGRGYSLRQLHERLRDRLLAAPPERVVALTEDSGMRLILASELKERLACPVEACSPADLTANRELLIGALVVSPQGHIPGIAALLPPERPAIPLTYSSPDGHVDLVRGLTAPSLIVVVSVSEYFLKMARSVLAPAVGERHALREYLLDPRHEHVPGAADVVVCDSLAYRGASPLYRSAKVIRHQLISPACLDLIATTFSEAQSVKET